MSDVTLEAVREKRDSYKAVKAGLRPYGLGWLDALNWVLRVYGHATVERPQLEELPSKASP